MPQAIRPGAYATRYNQELLKNISTQLAQMLGGGALAPIIANSPLMLQVDSAINGSVVSIDGQLASVGISVDSGISQPPAANVPNNGPRPLTVIPPNNQTPVINAAPQRDVATAPPLTVTGNPPIFTLA